MGVFYEAEPLSRNQLRKYAMDIRKILNIQSLNFPIVMMLEYILPQIIPGFNYEYINDSEWNKIYGENKHAVSDISAKIIKIKNSVYERAALGHGRDRMTIAHEIAHMLLLSLSGVKFFRTIGEKQPPAYRDPEWQAKCLAGELMIPYNQCKNLTADQIMKACGVSKDAAEFQISKF